MLGKGAGGEGARPAGSAARPIPADGVRRLKPGDARFGMTVGDAVGKLGKIMEEMRLAFQEARIMGLKRSGAFGVEAHGVNAETGIEPVELGLEEPRKVNGIAGGNGERCIENGARAVGAIKLQDYAGGAHARALEPMAETAGKMIEKSDEALIRDNGSIRAWRTEKEG